MIVEIDEPLRRLAALQRMMSRSKGKGGAFMTAWPPEVPDPFNPQKSAFGRKLEGTWGRITREQEAASEPPAPPPPLPITLPVLKARPLGETKVSGAA